MFLHWRRSINNLLRFCKDCIRFRDVGVFADATVRSWPSLMFISDADTTTRSVTGSQKELLWQSRGADSLRKKPTIYYASAVRRRDRIAAPV